MKYSFVIPCYNSEKTIENLIEILIQELKMLAIEQYEVVLVNDFSKDGTLAAIKRLADKYKFVKGINFSKNFGQHNSIIAGMHQTTGDIIVCMDDDLQTHPSQLKLLFRKLGEGYDVVFGCYKKKNHAFYRNLGSAFNNWVYTAMMGKPKDLKLSSFVVMQRFVKDEIIRYGNSYTNLQGLILRSVSNVANQEIEHFTREIGESNYTLKKMIQLWISFTNFSIVPLRFASFLGFFFSIVGFGFSIVVIIRNLINPSVQLGWASMMATQLFFSGLILLCIGILGEYIGRVFISLNNAPQYVVKEKYNIDEEKNEDSSELD